MEPFRRLSYSGPFPLALYLDLKRDLAQVGYGEDVEWAESVREPADAEAFFREYAFVVVNSGMKATIAGPIFRRIMEALHRGETVRSAFGHPGKAAGIQRVYDEREAWFQRYREAEDKLAFLRAMPWIGGITQYHLLKNLGGEAPKPDRHLVRIAASYGTDTFTLCAALAEATGDHIGTVDVVPWRAASLGWL